MGIQSLRNLTQAFFVQELQLKAVHIRVTVACVALFGKTHAKCLRLNVVEDATLVAASVHKVLVTSHAKIKL